MAIRKGNTTNANTASTVTADTENDTDTDTNTAETPAPKRRGGGRPGPKGPALRWNKQRKLALVLVIRRLAKGILPGGLTTLSVVNYLNGTTPVPKDQPEVQEYVNHFKGVEELITPVKVNMEKNKINDALKAKGKDELPEFTRTRETINADIFDDIE